MAKVAEAQLGSVFGRLTIVQLTRQVVGSQLHWFAQCSCSCGSGKVPKWYRLSHLGTHTTSCGCTQSEVVSKLFTKHGKTNSQTYNTWRAMWERCTNPNNIGYKDYHNFQPPDSWKDFNCFLADMGERPQGKTLDRVDNTKPYGPQNCRWATVLEQAANRKANIWLKHPEHGKAILAQARRLSGLGRGTSIGALQALGWSIIDNKLLEKTT